MRQRQDWQWAGMNKKEKIKHIIVRTDVEHFQLLQSVNSGKIRESIRMEREFAEVRELLQLLRHNLNFVKAEVERSQGGNMRNTFDLCNPVV